MTNPSFSPTPQQDAAVLAAKSGGNVVITACAGSGKTSTLRLIADALAPAKGLYIAYNKAIQTDASKSFPANVECRTAHSLAFRARPDLGKRAMQSPRMPGWKIAKFLGIDRSFPIGNDREIGQGRLGSLVMATVGKWANSADSRILAKHADAVIYDIPGVADGGRQADLANYLAAQAQRAWEIDLSKPVGTLPYSHDLYVVAWALSDPILPGDFILYDEAQDADPRIASVVLKQQGKQLIAVGDENQAIYGWRGATDAMASWPAAHRVALTQSFRFGQPVADEANVFLGLLGSPMRVEGFDKIPSVVGPVAEPTAILTRTNAGLISQAMAFHRSRKYAIVGGTQTIQKFAEAARDLMAGKRAAWHPDLGPFKSWDDVVDYVQHDDGGSDLRTLVNLIEDYGCETVIEVANNATTEARADVILSTAHKSKGREFDHVVIADDFQPTDSNGDPKTSIGRAEAMLMYVAVTRAKLSLDCSSLAWAKNVTVNGGGHTHEVHA